MIVELLFALHVGGTQHRYLSLGGSILRDPVHTSRRHGFNALDARYKPSKNYPHRKIIKERMKK